MEKRPEVIEGTDKIPPQIYNEHLMTEEERSAAYKKVEDWYALKQQPEGDK